MTSCCCSVMLRLVKGVHVAVGLSAVPRFSSCKLQAEPIPAPSMTPEAVRILDIMGLSLSMSNELWIRVVRFWTHYLRHHQQQHQQGSAVTLLDEAQDRVRITNCLWVTAYGSLLCWAMHAQTLGPCENSHAPALQCQQPEYLLLHVLYEGPLRGSAYLTCIDTTSDQASLTHHGTNHFFLGASYATTCQHCSCCHVGGPRAGTAYPPQHDAHDP